MSWQPPEQPQWPPPEQPPWQSQWQSQWQAQQPAGQPGAAVFGRQEASWWSRVGAAVLDAIIVTAGLFAVILVAILAFGAWDEETTDAQDAGIGLITMAALVGAYLYYPLTMARKGDRNGQTLGKQAAGIRVVRESGRPVGFWYAAGREWLAKGIIATVTLGIDYLWPLWDARRQALHDKAARSLVLRG